MDMPDSSEGKGREIIDSRSIKHFLKNEATPHPMSLCISLLYLYKDGWQVATCVLVWVLAWRIHPNSIVV